MHRRALSLLLVSSLLHMLLLASADAQDAATQFEGTHEAGGTVRFTIGAGGAEVVALELEGLAGGGCSWGTIDVGNWGGAIPFKDGAFRAVNADGDAIQGQFVDAGRAEGSVLLHDPTRGCETPPLRWVAAAVSP